MAVEPKLLLSSRRPSPPLLPSAAAAAAAARSHLFPQRSHLSLQRSHLSLQRSSFLGTSLSHRPNKLQERARRPLHPVAAGVKWRKERPFDNAIQRDKKLKLVLKIRSILVSQPSRIMNLRDLGPHRRHLGLTHKRRFITLLKRFPAVFEIVEEGVYSLRFRLTPDAERLYLNELAARNEMERLLVVKLRKLLMMSLDKRILIEKIAHLKTDLGLPQEFRDTICRRYPQYFQVVATDRGPVLELTHWDPALAVSETEEADRTGEADERDLIIDRPPRFKRVKLPKGLNLSKGEMRRICQFNDMPYISPYSDFSQLRAGSPEKERHACAVVHEMLNLTLEKRTLVDHLTHFREEFLFSQQLRGMLIRHPDMFYVSLKGDRDSVFLREAYRDSNLTKKNKLLLLKEKLRALVAVPQLRGRVARRTDGADGSETAEEGSGQEDDRGWTDVDGMLPDELGSEFDDGDGGEDDDAGEDDWSDEEGEVPPDFDDGESLIFEGGKLQMLNGSAMKGGKVLAPVLPDGRPREQW